MKKKNKEVSRISTKKRISLKSKLSAFILTIVIFIGGSLYFAINSGTGPLSFLTQKSAINVVAQCSGRSENDCEDGCKWTPPGITTSSSVVPCADSDCTKGVTGCKETSTTVNTTKCSIGGYTDQSLCSTVHGTMKTTSTIVKKCGGTHLVITPKNIPGSCGGTPNTVITPTNDSSSCMVKCIARGTSPSTCATSDCYTPPVNNPAPVKSGCDKVCADFGLQSGQCLACKGSQPAPAIIVTDAKTVCETRHDPKQTCVYNDKLTPACKCTDLPGGGSTPEIGKAGCGGGLVPIKDGQTVPSGHMFDGDPKKMECFTCKNGTYTNRQVCADALANDPKNTILPVNAGDNYTGGAKPPKPCIDSTSGNVGNTASGNLNGKGETCINGDWIPKGQDPKVAGNSYCAKTNPAKPEWNNDKGICEAQALSPEQVKAQKDKELAEKIAAQQKICSAMVPAKKSNAQGTDCVSIESIACNALGKGKGGCKDNEVCTQKYNTKTSSMDRACELISEVLSQPHNTTCNGNSKSVWNKDGLKFDITFCPAGCNVAKNDCNPTIIKTVDDPSKCEVNTTAKRIGGSDSKEWECIPNTSPLSNAKPAGTTAKYLKDGNWIFEAANGKRYDDSYCGDDPNSCLPGSTCVKYNGTTVTRSHCEGPKAPAVVAAPIAADIVRVSKESDCPINTIPDNVAGTPGKWDCIPIKVYDINDNKGKKALKVGESCDETGIYSCNNCPNNVATLYETTSGADKWMCGDKAVVASSLKDKAIKYSNIVDDNTKYLNESKVNIGKECGVGSFDCSKCDNDGITEDITTTIISENLDGKKVTKTYCGDESQVKAAQGVKISTKDEAKAIDALNGNNEQANPVIVGGSVTGICVGSVLVAGFFTGGIAWAAMPGCAVIGVGSGALTNVVNNSSSVPGIQTNVKLNGKCESTSDCEQGLYCKDPAIGNKSCKPLTEAKQPGDSCVLLGSESCGYCPYGYGLRDKAVDSGYVCNPKPVKTPSELNTGSLTK